MKILVVSSFLPFPLYSGGNVRLFNLLKKMSQKHDLVLVCEKRVHQTANDVKELQKICKEVYVFDRKKQWSVRNILKAIFTQDAFLIVGHTLPAMKRKITELLSNEHYDLIHCETSYIMQNIPKTKVPIVLAEHNLEYAIYEKFASQKRFPLKQFLNIDIKKLKRNEINNWKQAKTVVAVSDKERKVMAKYALQTAVVPNGVDLDKYKFKKINSVKRDFKILFIGDFSYIQNIDACSYLIREIYPDLSQKIEGVKLWIVGRRIPQEIKKLSENKNIILDENATQPTQEIFSKADLLLAPLRVSGGTQYKILESLAVGTPVVTTSIGAEGIEARQGILIGDTIESLVESCRKILTDKQLYLSLAKQGREMIEEHYEWGKIAQKLDKVWEEAQNA